MAKTNRLKNKNKSKSKTTRKRNLNTCSIGLKPFEEKFSKTIPSKQLKLSNKKKKREIVKVLLSKFAPNSIKPKNDFYDYINYQWLKNVSLEKQQEYIVQIDNFRLARDKVFHELDEIILQYIKTHNDKLSKNLKNYYTSVINMNPKSYTRQLAKESVQLVEDFLAGTSPWELLAYINKDEMLAASAPFVWSLNPYYKNNKQYRCNIDSHQFALLDLSVYYDDGTNIEYKKKYIDNFKNYNKKLFNTLLGHNNFNPQDIFDVEIEMFSALSCVKVTENEENLYSTVYADEALTKYGFDWKTFSKALGFKTPPNFFVVSSLNYLKCCSELLNKNWNNDKWKTYWTWIFLRRLARITRGWEEIYYNFYGNFERGQKRINKTDAVSASLYMSVPFNKFLTDQYVAKYENPQSIEYVKTLCTDLKIVFHRILMRNNWLSPSTKKYALKKLTHFKFIYGKPENIREDPDLNYTTTLYDNMQKIIQWRHNKFIELEGKAPIDLPMMDWTQYPVKMSGSQAYIVNASYTPSKNAIYINLGYIQKPFIDLDERGIEYNLSHIGFTIGHEMSHGFDDWGSQYDYNGNLYNWWTPEDKKKYKAILNDVI